MSHSLARVRSDPLASLLATSQSRLHRQAWGSCRPALAKMQDEDSVRSRLYCLLFDDPNPDAVGSADLMDGVDLRRKARPTQEPAEVLRAAFHVRGHIQWSYRAI